MKRETKGENGLKKKGEIGAGLCNRGGKMWEKMVKVKVEDRDHFLVVWVEDSEEKKR